MAQLPPSRKIEEALRSVVAELYQAGNLEELTVKRVRHATEKQLGLDNDFLKTDPDWRDKSKTIISNEVESQERKAEEPAPAVSKKSAHKPAAEAKGKSKPVKPRQSREARDTSKTTKVPKRASPVEKSKPRKRRKVVESDESEADSAAGSDVEHAKDLVSSEDTEPETMAKKSGTQSSPKPGPVDLAPAAKIDQENVMSESELSSVIDEPPKVAKRRQKKVAGGEPTKSSKLSKPKPTKGKAAQDADSNDVEIKRLQGWLIKCGIRKMWHRELAQYDTPRAKINHLKELLKEAGMDGRYSVEKARQIKEQRELAADLEAVQEGEKRWGKKDGDDEAENSGRPRRLARGLQELEFLGDGEETD